MTIVDLVRKKILGKNLYEACKSRDPRVNNTLLQKRLRYIQKKGIYPTLTLNDVIHLCDLKKRKVFAMDGDGIRNVSGQPIRVEEDYFQRIPLPRQQGEEKKEEDIEDIEDEGELVDIDVSELPEIPTDFELQNLPGELHFLKNKNCMMFDVIKNLHRILILHNVCFLQGAFVFADKDGNLFKKLLSRCDFKYRRSFFKNISHSVFIEPTHFDNRNKQSRLDKDFLIKQKLYYPGAVSFKVYMYEVNIQDENKRHFDYNYACDEKCQEDDNDKGRCPDNIKQTKKIILMYPFQVIVGNTKKRYLYLKLEDSHAASAEHAVGATKAYIWNPLSKLFGVKPPQEKYPIRRERITLSDVPYRESELPRIDSRFNQSVNSDLNEVMFYNLYVRNHNEFFISQKITDELTQNIELEREEIDELP